MLVLFETPAGYALFKLRDDGKLDKPDDLQKDFASPESANRLLKLKAFGKFENTTDAMQAVTGIVEGKMPKNLKKFLSKELSEQEMKTERLVVGDAKLGASISKKLGITVVSDSSVNELMRGIRSQLESLLQGIPESDLRSMVLGLSHSLSRYKLKFSPDKVDTMIIQAISLLDDLDKELNTYAMRIKEWYGWHFPEMQKIIVDNLAYAKVIKAVGVRTKMAAADLSTILPEELEKELKEAAEVSMGTEISEEDIENITFLSDQVVSIAEYRAQLYDYLKNRMAAIAPNLTVLVGELVGARLIAHAGSLMNLAKYPASTVQILGAEKALFRALKTKHDTPKYGLLYHASLVGQAAPKLKGKMARAVATKAALSIRVDALGDKDTPEIGIEMRAKTEARLRQLEGRQTHISNKGAGKGKSPQQKFELAKGTKTYNVAADVEMNGAEKTPNEKKSKDKKRSAEEAQTPAAEDTPNGEEGTEKKKKKKDKSESSSKKRKAEAEDEPEGTPTGEKRKKKKDKKADD